MFNLPPLVGIVPNHSKRHKTESEDIASGVAVVLVDLCSGNQKVHNYLRRIVYEMLRPMLMKLRLISQKVLAPKITIGPSPFESSHFSSITKTTFTQNVLKISFSNKKTSFEKSNLHPPIILNPPATFIGGIKSKDVNSSLSDESY